MEIMAKPRNNDGRRNTAEFTILMLPFAFYSSTSWLTHRDPWFFSRLLFTFSKWLYIERDFYKLGTNVQPTYGEPNSSLFATKQKTYYYPSPEDLKGHLIRSFLALPTCLSSVIPLAVLFVNYGRKVTFLLLIPVYSIFWHFPLPLSLSHAFYPALVLGRTAN